MKLLEPIYVADLFQKLDSELIALLKTLSDEDWHKSTVCAEWNVKDIVAHLLDGNFRTLSTKRDGYFGIKPEGVDSYHGLVAFLNRINAEWVAAAKRLSPQVLIWLMEETRHDVYKIINALDPHDVALHSVAWAGEDVSENWFDIARGYTEHWHHQQQIRLAVNKPGAMTRELYFPVIDAFMRALPYTYRHTEANERTLLKFHIAGEAGSVWFLLRENAYWILGTDAQSEPASEVTIPQEIAWLLFTKGINKEEARKQITITGDENLGSVILNMTSVMA